MTIRENKGIKITWNAGYFSKESTTEIPTEIITPNSKVERLFIKPNISIKYPVEDLGPYFLQGELPSGQKIGKSLILTKDQADGEIVIEDSETLPSQTMNLHKFFGTYPEKSSDIKKSNDRNPSSNSDEAFWLRLWSFESSQETKWKANKLEDPKIKRHKDLTLIFFEGFPSNSPCYLELGQPGHLSQFVAIPPASKVQAIVRPSSNSNMKTVHGGLSIKIISLEPQHDLAQSVLSYYKHASFQEVKDLVIKMRENLANDNNNFDPFITAVAGYFLLKMGETDLIGKMAKNFYETVDWLPDSALIYAWYLISEGFEKLNFKSSKSHITEIKNALLTAVSRGLPLFSIGLRFLFEKLRQIETNVPSDSPEKNSFSNVIKELGRRLAACDEKQPMTTFLGVSPWKPTLDSQLIVPPSNRFYVKSKSDISFLKERIVRELTRALPFSIGLQEPIKPENLIEITGLSAQLEKLIKDNPELNLGAFDCETLGDAIFLQGRYEIALDYFDKAINIDKRIFEVFYSKGVTLGRLKEHEKALTCFEKAIEIYPEHVDSWIGKAVALYKLEKCEQAIECCDKALEIEPRSYRACNNKGVFLLQSKQYSEAIRCFENALEINPTFANAFYNMACSYALQKETEKAVDCLEKTININPDFKEIAEIDEDFDNLRNNEKFLELIDNKNRTTDLSLSDSAGYLPHFGVIRNKSRESELVPS